ncbi:MAG TPA: PD-(D/E)XK nuclease family protein [Acidobacteriota bacterium]|nr:PD-(D/E)XK nuclease family protein [Acidobacteriota bacterium]
MTKATTGKRTRNLFDPAATKPYKLSRSKLERFTQCPRCFYLDRRLGVDRPDMPGWTLNTAVDALLKNEFDAYRDRGEPHPLMQRHGIDAVPFRHPDLDVWRQNLRGIQFHHQPTNLVISGAVDDVWIGSIGKLHVVDYKSTSTTQEISFDGHARREYKRQAEIYQWLLRQNGHDVSDTAYFVYANAHRDRPEFAGRLEFDLLLFPYDGSAAWVERCVVDAHRCLMSDAPPPPASGCSYCLYRLAAGQVGV